MKKEHVDFLHDQVIFFLDDGPDARAGVVGQASLTGESAHNDELSANRAKAAMNYLTTKGIASSRFQPSESIALGDAPSGPAKEDKRDRSVTLNLKFSVTIEDLYLYSDDWTHRLDWDDIIALDTADHGKRYIFRGFHRTFRSRPSGRSFLMKRRPGRSCRPISGTRVAVRILPARER